MSWQKKEISAVASTIKILHIQKDMHFIYKQYFYKDKQKEIYELFIEYLVSIIHNLDHFSLIEEWKINIDAAAHEKKLNKDVKIPSINKK